MSTEPLDPDAIRRLLERLDPLAAVSGTVALHDPLYALLTAPGEAHRLALVRALQDHPEHPLALELWTLLGARPEPDSLEAVLRRHEPLPAGADPVVEVDRRLARHAERERILRRRIEEVEASNQALVRTANALAAVGALVAVLALLGWLVALGGWRIDWIELPAPPEAGAPAAAPTPPR